MSTQTTVSVFLVLFCIGYSRGEWGLENLGAQINAEVQRSIAPLHNLGHRIRSDVKNSVGNDFNPLDRDFNPLGSDWNAKFSSNLKSKLAPLDNLGDKIRAQVEESLKPVRIMESTFKVKLGTDGTTVATYMPGEKNLIIKESTLYVCGGRISDADGTCSEGLKQLEFVEKEDFCYAINKAIVNNWYCLGSSGSLSVLYVNDNFTCESSNGSPVLRIEAEKYHELCKNVAKSVSYKYYTRLPLQDFGNGLECSGHDPQICTYSEDLSRVGSQIIHSGNIGSTIIINTK